MQSSKHTVTMADEINLTLFHPPSSKTDAISLPPSTTLTDLSSFASAILGLDDSSIVISKDSFASLPLLFSPMNAATDGSKALAQCGIVNGDLLSVMTKSEFDQLRNRGSPARQRQRTGPPAAAAAPSGGLDFSALLGAAASQPPPAATHNGGSGTTNGLTFNIQGLLAASNANSNSANSSQKTPPVQWDGMHLDDAISRNPDPHNLMTILTNTSRHPNLLKELNYHNPTMYKKLMSANNDIAKMANIWRETTMKSTTARFLQHHSQQSKEMEMRQRLQRDPMDAEANKYFGEKIREENVQRQYEQMMEDYPESMGRVLMLYINCLVNEKPLQVFVDSGAQSTIMSSECADRLGLLHLVDKRFEGVAVGVGTGKILGKIHVVELTIGGYAFPCSITVMDSESGLGDKNMDCLFGLDMLKRHRCCIDLAKNALVFPLGLTGESMEAPFLHEKDLPTSKGGTMGFDAERENAELEARWEKMDTEEDDADKQEKEDGDNKNMDCLFGLDMLKRHRCCIDLAKNALVFPLGLTGESMEAPFLHEKDLPTSKGGTMGFDAERENAELEARWEKMDTEEDDADKQEKEDGD
ncbi:aspartic peptidase, DDI1 family, partial [Skeletonema marinoi]